MCESISKGVCVVHLCATMLILVFAHCHSYCVNSVWKRRCACVTFFFFYVCFGGWDVHQSATCSQSCSPALTPWIIEQAAHEELIHTQMATAPIQTLLYILADMHTGRFHKPNKRHIDSIVTRMHDEKKADARTNELWLSCACRNTCWSLNPWLCCWWIGDHCFNSHWNVMDVSDLVLENEENRNIPLSLPAHAAADQIPITVLCGECDQTITKTAEYCYQTPFDVIKGALKFCVCVHVYV